MKFPSGTGAEKAKTVKCFPLSSVLSKTCRKELTIAMSAKHCTGALFEDRSYTMFLSNCWHPAKLVT